MNLPNDVQNDLARHAGNTLTLPYLARVLRDSGWTLSAIAEPLGLTRERVRQIINSATDKDYESLADFANSIGFEIPAPPPKPVLEERKKSVRPTVGQENIERMLELQPFARQVRSNSPLYRAEGEEYTRLIAYEHLERGVSLFSLSKELGVTHGALRFRLVRYGYKEATSEHKVYKPISQENRVHG